MVQLGTQPRARPSRLRGVPRCGRRLAACPLRNPDRSTAGLARGGRGLKDPAIGAGGDLPIPRRSAILKEAALPELIDNPIPQSAAMVDRVKFLAVGGYREGMRHAEDYDSAGAALHRRARCGHLPASYASRPGDRAALLMLQNAWEARLDSRARLQARGGSTRIMHGC